MRPAECFIVSKREAAAFSTQAEARHGTKLTQNRNHLYNLCKKKEDRKMG